MPAFNKRFKLGQNKMQTTLESVLLPHQGTSQVGQTKTLNLRDYQVQMKRDFYGHVRGGAKKVLIVAGTGAGKTELATAIAQDALSKGRRVSFIVHRDNLCRQTIKRFSNYGLNPSAVHPDFPKEYDNPCQVVSIQTMARRPKDLWLLSDIVLYDEAHITSWSTLGKQLIQTNHHAITAGLTATPWRLKKTESMGDLFNELVLAPLPIELMEMGYLVFPRYFGLPGIDTSKVKTSMGDFALDDLAKVTNDPEVVIKAVDNWERLGDNRKTIAFCVNVNHSKMLTNEFLKRGVKCAHVDGTMPILQRESVYDSLQYGETQVVTSCEALCLDSETEILTRSGWVKMNNMTYSHKVANWDNGKIFFKEPQNIVIRDRKPDEKMVVFKSERVDLRVTENHKMVYQRLGCNLKKTEAINLVGETVRIPVSGYSAPDSNTLFLQESRVSSRERMISATAFNLRKKNGYSYEDSLKEATLRTDKKLSLRYKQPNELTASECKLIGFWLADGSKNRKNNGGYEWKMSSTSKDIGVVQQVDNLLESCGIKCKKRLSLPKGCFVDLVTWSLKRGTFQDGGIYPIEPYLDKSLGDWLWDLTESQFDDFIFGYWLGDGHHGKHGVIPCHKTKIISCKNMDLLSLIQSVAVCRGYYARIKKNKDPLRTNTIYLQKQSHSTVGSEKGNPPYIEVTFKDEKVWCVTTDSKNIVVRRNGKVSITGNCEGFDVPSIGCVMLCRPTKSRSKYYQQMGRGLRISPGKTDLIVLDQAGNVARHGFIEDLTKKDFQLNLSPEHFPGEAPIKECPSCHSLVRIAATECPNCGHKFPIRAKQKADGELIELRVKFPTESNLPLKYQQFRVWKREAFQKRIAPGYALVKFKEQFGKDQWVPKEVELGALFNGNPTKSQTLSFKKYLLTIAQKKDWDDDRIQKEWAKEMGANSWQR